jgi:transcriptional regulator with XRE-family HTH domain
MSFFGKNIKKIRSVKHMSQLDFAALFDLKRGTLGAYEEGRSEPKIDTIIKVSQYFKISTDKLLTRELTVNQLLNFSTEIHDDSTETEDANNISIPLFSGAKIGSILVDSWDETLLSSLSSIQIPLNSASSIAFQHSTKISLQYTSTTLMPGDILFAAEQDLESNDTITSTYIILYMSQLLLVDGTIENGILQSIIAPAIDTKDCIKVWNITAHLNATYKPQSTSAVMNRLAALEKEVRLLKG